MEVVEQARYVIDTDGRLYAEMPLIAWFAASTQRANHSGSLRRARQRSNQRGIDDRPAMQAQSLAGKMGVDLRKQRLSQPVGLQQAATIDNRCLVRNHIVSLQLGKATHGCCIVERRFHSRVTQGRPLLPKGRCPAVTMANRVFRPVLTSVARPSVS